MPPQPTSAVACPIAGAESLRRSGVLERKRTGRRLKTAGALRRSRLSCATYSKVDFVKQNHRHQYRLLSVLSSYVDYYQRTRTHLSLDKDCPDTRPIMPPRIGKVVTIPQVGGLHHRYERLAA